VARETSGNDALWTERVYTEGRKGVKRRQKGEKSCVGKNVSALQRPPCREERRQNAGTRRAIKTKRERGKGGVE